MENDSFRRDGQIRQNRVPFLLVLFLSLVFMDPFQMGPLGGRDYRQLKHTVAPYKQVKEEWPWDHQSRLKMGKLEFVDEVYGPESTEFDLEGRGPYTGMADGRVVRWMGESIGWETFAVVTANWSETVCNGVDSTTYKQSKHEQQCGLPLGLKFDRATGDLYIADAYYGLSKGGTATRLATHAGGRPILFANDLDIHRNGTIFFTDTSTTDCRDHFFILLEGEATGRLLRYDPSSRTTHVVLDGLAFANRVQLSRGQTFLLFTETTNCRLMRLWLEGSQTGEVEVFANLPGFSDNIRLNDRDQFWVAMDCYRTPCARDPLQQSMDEKHLLQVAAENEFFSKTITGMKMYTVISLFNEKGKVLEALEDRNGDVMKLVSEVKEVEGKLWIGTVAEQSRGTHPSYVKLEKP